MPNPDPTTALSERRRRYEWQLAQAVQVAAAADFVAGKTHDLANLVQIVQLATAALERHCPPEAQRYLEELSRAGDDAHRSLTALIARARPEPIIVRGDPLGPALAAATAALAPFTVDLTSTADPATTTRALADDLEQLLVALALAAPPPIAIRARTRAIAGAPWLELLRACPTAPDPHELAVLAAIATRAGGEASYSDGELAVALPIL